MRRLQPYSVVIASSAESMLRRQPTAYASRLVVRLHELAEMAARSPSSLVTSWSPSQQQFPPLTIEFESRIVVCEIDERRRELRMVSLREL